MDFLKQDELEDSARQPRRQFHGYRPAAGVPDKANCIRVREKGSHPRFGVFRRRLVVFVPVAECANTRLKSAPRRAARTISGKRDWRRLTYGLTARMSPSPIGCSSPSRPVQPLQGLRTLELEPWPVLRKGEDPSAL